MVQAINMASNATSGMSVSVTAKKSEKEQSEQTAAASKTGPAPQAPPAAKSDSTQSVTESEQGDILELSSQGVAQAKTAVQQAAASVVSGTTASSSSSTVNSSDLSKYSETELQDLVKKGTITTQQMNAELAERAKKEKTESGSDSTAAETEE